MQLCEELGIDPSSVGPSLFSLANLRRVETIVTYSLGLGTFLPSFGSRFESDWRVGEGTLGDGLGSNAWKVCVILSWHRLTCPVSWLTVYLPI